MTLHYPTYKPFNCSDIVPLPSHNAPITVYIGDMPYAGFNDLEHAEEAVRLWRLHWAVVGNKIIKITAQPLQ